MHLLSLCILFNIQAQCERPPEVVAVRKAKKEKRNLNDDGISDDLTKAFAECFLFDDS